MEGDKVFIEQQPKKQQEKQPLLSTLNLDRVKGCLHGALMGDAAGAILQFHFGQISQKLAKQCFSFPGGGLHKVLPAQITDDGQLTLSLARGLIHGKGNLNLHEIATQYGVWIKSRPFDIGNTTRKSLGKATKPFKGFVGVIKKAASEDSESNGCLMRITPMAIWGHKLSDWQLIEAAMLDTKFTHKHIIPIQCCALYCVAIKHLINGKARSQAYDIVFELAKMYEMKIRSWFQQIIDPNKTIEKVMVNKNVGHVKIAFCYAFHYLKNNFSYYDALVDVLTKRGDTDTNACIIGGLLGAADGYESIPLQVRKSFLKESKIKKMKGQTRLKYFDLIAQLQADEMIERLLKVAPQKLNIDQ